MAATGFTPIQLYRTATAAAAPTAGNLADGELAINTLDEKLYFKNSAGTVKLLASNAASTGTVSSVAATVPAFLSIAGSPITTSGTLAITYSGTALPIANGGTGATSRQDAMDALAGAVTSGQYLRGNGTDVVMSAIQAADVPTLNQNTTGTAANVTGTVAVANGGTGATTAAAARTGLGATTLGANIFTVANPSAVTFPRFNADNTLSALSAADFRTAIGAGTGGGSVSSVSGTGTVNGITLTGTVTSTGNLTLGGTLSGVNLTTQVTGTLPVANGGTGNTTAQAAMNTFAAAVTSGQYLRGNGTNVVMSAIQAADVPTLNQSTSGNAATATVLQTARNIGGVSFNGSADINLPGVNTAGNQNTTGTAANVTGTVAIANGGTGATSLAAAGIATLTGTQTLTNKTIEAGTFTNGYTEETVVANTSTAYTIDLANGTVQYLTLTGNCTYTFPTPVAGKSFILIQKQDGTGSRTVTWPASVDWPGATAPTLTSTASKADKFVFTAIDGSNWLGSVAGQNYTV